MLQKTNDILIALDEAMKERRVKVPLLSKQTGIPKDRIYKRFKQTRAEAGMTQEEMAEAVGITRSAVKQIETGRMIPNIYILRRWRQVFKRSYDWILDGKEKSQGK